MNPHHWLQRKIKKISVFISVLRICVIFNCLLYWINPLSIPESEPDKKVRSGSDQKPRPRWFWPKTQAKVVLTKNPGQGGSGNHETSATSANSGWSLLPSRLFDWIITTFDLTYLNCKTHVQYGTYTVFSCKYNQFQFHHGGRRRGVLTPYLSGCRSEGE